MRSKRFARSAVHVGLGPEAKLDNLRAYLCVLQLLSVCLCEPVPLSAVRFVLQIFGQIALEDTTAPTHLPLSLLPVILSRFLTVGLVRNRLATRVPICAKAFTTKNPGGHPSGNKWQRELRTFNYVAWLIAIIAPLFFFYCSLYFKCSILLLLLGKLW